MTARISLKCDGMIGGADLYECRQAIFVGEPDSGRAARYVARTEFGWSSVLIDGEVHDFCEACTTRRLIHR